MILGLDISSNIIGVTVLNLDGKLEYCSFIDLRTTKKAAKEQFQDIFDKLKFCNKWLMDFKTTWGNKITEVHIEEALSKFTPGKSSMHTLQTLFKMNYVISYEIFRLFGIKPIYWHPNSVRSQVSLKIPKGSDTKKLVFEYACKLYSDFKKMIPDKLPQSNPWVDVADSILIARAGFLTYNDRHGKDDSNSN